MNAIATPAMRYHGAKFRLADWVMSFFPPHRTYVEAFGGAAGVLIQKPRAYSEVYNDLDGNMVNFFRVVRDPALCARLIDLIAQTPYAREEFELSAQPTEDPVERARRTVIRAQMGFGPAGATKAHTGFRIDTARDYGTAQAMWVRYPDTLAILGRRMVGVLVENRPAIDVMLQHDRGDTLQFLDPPYLHGVRKMGGSRKIYAHEMSDDDHEALLTTAQQLESMVCVCGYPSELYDDMLAGWLRVETSARISAGRGTATRTEVMWLNPACAQSLKGGGRLL